MDNNTDILSVNDVIEQIIGDVPVSVQLNEALDHMASKDHRHDNYVSREEFNKLKQIVENLVSLVGDESVAVQINNAITKG